MNVLLLSTLDTRGGAARAAWRLHQGLLAEGGSSRMLVRTRLTDDETIRATDDGTIAGWHEQMLTPWLRSHLSEDAPWFTSGVVSQDISTHPWVQAADVLHLHWVAEWLSAESIARLLSLGKPVFWTFHDLWAVTCGSHYAGVNSPSGDGWQTGDQLPAELREIGRREFERKRHHLASRNLCVLGPSEWITELAQRSIIGAAWSAKVLPNGIGASCFQPAPAAQARLRWNLPADKQLLLFGCSAISERRKGFHLLVEALQSAALDPAKVALVLFGADQPDLSALPIPAHHAGSISSEADMASLYTSADAYLCPTLEDNLPNTVLESLACGVPVIGFATGGVPDMVRDGDNGLLASCGDAAALATCLARFTTDGSLRKKLQSAAQQADKSGYTLQTQARRCIELYQKALGASKAAPASSGEWYGAPSMVPGEESWMLQAAAVTARRAGERERELRDKLTQSKSRLQESKDQVTRLKADLKVAKTSVDASQRKGWRRWFR